VEAGQIVFRGPGVDISAAKRVLRRALVARILALDAAERLRQDAALAEIFPTLPGFAEARSVLLYVTAFPEELSTGPMLRQALALGKTLVCPRVDRVARRLVLFRVENLVTDLVPGTLGIPEPRQTCTSVDPGEVDWVLVPGLAFDDRCYRLGRGAGHYDRFLPLLRPETPRWSLALEPQWEPALPIEPHDQQVDGVASPNRRSVKGRV
jgi:5-formyltetrahydrofolate cyclo-ligase